MPRSARARSRIVKPLRNGQITIPSEFRRELGLGEDTLLRMTLEGDELRLRKVELRETAKGSPWLRPLYEAFAPLRQDLSSLDEAEIDKDIDRAIREVRRNNRA